MSPRMQCSNPRIQKETFKYKASIEEVNDNVEEAEIEDEVDVETEEDIYL